MTADVALTRRHILSQERIVASRETSAGRHDVAIGSQVVASVAGGNQVARNRTFSTRPMRGQGRRSATGAKFFARGEVQGLVPDHLSRGGDLSGGVGCHTNRKNTGNNNIRIKCRITMPEHRAAPRSRMAMGLIQSCLVAGTGGNLQSVLGRLGEKAWGRPRRPVPMNGRAQ